MTEIWLQPAGPAPGQALVGQEYSVKQEPGDRKPPSGEEAEKGREDGCNGARTPRAPILDRFNTVLLLVT